MKDYFLDYIIKENRYETVDELLAYAVWNNESTSEIKYPKQLNISTQLLSDYKNRKSSKDLLTELYEKDDELLFLLTYSQRLIYWSNLKHVFTYNSDLENPEFDYNHDVHEFLFMTDVDVFMIKTINKIFFFGDTKQGVIDFEPTVIYRGEDISKNSVALKLFNRLKGNKIISSKIALSYAAFENIIDKHFKKQ